MQRLMETATSTMAAAVSTSESVPEYPVAVTRTDKKNIIVLKARNQNPFGPEQTFYLCGTSHVSKKSCDDVRDLIQAVKPQVIMLELCYERRSMLQPIDKSLQHQSLKQHLQLWRDGKEALLTVIYSWMLGQVAEKCEIDPGEEFRVALEEAMKIGAKVNLGDRLVSVTIARTWGALSRWQKFKLIFELLYLGVAVPSKEVTSILDSLTEDSDLLTEAIKDFGQAHPSVLRPLIEERDEYMVYNLRQLSHQASTIVAVVGAGHLQGIQEKWESEIDIAEISQMPVKAQSSSRSWGRLLLITSAGTATIATIALAIHWRRQR